MAGLRAQTMWCRFLSLLIIHAIIPTSSLASLKLGFYQKTCPEAQAVIKETVARAAAKDPGIAASLIRLHFHDCFVRGCDASVLLDPTPGHGRVEKQAKANFPSLRGYEVIDDAKAKLESRCPRTVSCADVVAFAARDAARLAGGIEYKVPAGRRDGNVSIDTEARPNLPLPYDNLEQIVGKFARKRLSVEDMVALSGSHSVGVSHCSSFSTRVYRFNATHPQDPSMDPGFAASLKARCPAPGGSGGGEDPTVPMDVATPDRLDNTYYKNLRENKGLLASDQVLADSPRTAKLVESHARRPDRWSAKFAKAMVKMGKIEVLTGDKGEIRQNCRVVNRN